MSCAPIASVTAAADAAALVVGDSAPALGDIRRPPSGTPAARPTAKASSVVTVLFMTLLRAADYTSHKAQVTRIKSQGSSAGLRLHASNGVLLSSRRRGHVHAYKVGLLERSLHES